MRAIFIGLLLFSVACSRPYVFDTPHPTKERIAELARIDKPVEVPLTPLTLRITPAIALSYTQIRVTCLLPAGSMGRYRFGVEGVFSEERDISYRELSKVITVGCTPLQAYCTLAQRGPGEIPKLTTVRLEIDPKGECR
jgi:hypothetical protein